MPTHSFVYIRNGYPTIDIGAMRHEVTIEQQAVSSPPTFDASGTVPAWTPFLTGVMAAINPISGKDVIKGGLTTTQLFLSVAMWYQPGIVANMRIVHPNGSKYLIQSIENVLEMNVVLTMNCIGLAGNE